MAIIKLLWPNKGMNCGEFKNWSFDGGRCNSVINFCNFSFFGLMLKVFPAVPPVYKPKIRRILSICLTKEEKDWPFTKLTFTLWSYNIFASYLNLKLRVNSSEENKNLHQGC